MGVQVFVDRCQVAQVAGGHVDLGIVAGQAQAQADQRPAGQGQYRGQAATEGVALVVDVGGQRRGDAQHAIGIAVELDLHGADRWHAVQYVLQGGQRGSQGINGHRSSDHDNEGPA
ncbi:hypothetical protein G6F62_012813 [Rhizopus arrhizus]|nr:hypothetical protein G6F62_012813 [Rhizopus arrhizus]